MKFLKKVLGRGRIRSARKLIATDPSPRSYAALAQEYARLGLPREALSVCEEGLASFSGNTLLSRLANRARRMEREDRIAKLKRSLAEAPGPGLWSEMCELLLELGQIARAEETAREWIDATDDPDAHLMLARVRVDRFFADRGRGLGLAAAATLEEALQRQPESAGALRLQLNFLTRIGAWKEARAVAGRLLQVEPGAADLEGRFRTLDERAAGAPSIERALLEVERTGRLVDEVEEGCSTGQLNIRPVLRELAADPDIHAALYVRGSTVLIQGPKGATAERIARAVRSILSSSSTTTRKLGLGQIFQVELEGDFGKLAVAPGGIDAGALWSQGPLGRKREETLLGLAGINVDLGGASS
jgi:tetratricopeptide (TPR) repeat protein